MHASLLWIVRAGSRSMDSGRWPLDFQSQRNVLPGIYSMYTRDPYPDHEEEGELDVEEKSHLCPGSSTIQQIYIDRAVNLQGFYDFFPGGG